jgi:hypothetical protein
MMVGKVMEEENTPNNEMEVDRGTGHDGFISSGDELEPEQPADPVESVQLVIVDPQALVRLLKMSQGH